MTPGASPRPSRELRPELTPERRRRLLLGGIELFNEGRMYESHELWEEVWRSNRPEPRDLFQGLIQVAVAVHLNRLRGSGPALRVLARGRRRLAGLPSPCCGLDVAGLIEAADRWRGWVLDGGAGEAPRLEIRILDPAAVR